MTSVKTLLGQTIFTLIAACLISGCLKTQAVPTKIPTTNGSAANDSQRSIPPKEIPVESVPSATKTSYEYVIYECQAGSEEIPAVHIAEVRDTKDERVTGISVHVTDPEKIDLTVKGGKAIWDYKAVSAHLGINTIQVTYDPQTDNAGYDWVLRIKGYNTNFETRVRNCMEISAE
jgi:hypothetical protein